MQKPRLDDGRTGEVREFLKFMGERARSADGGDAEALPDVGKLAGAILNPEGALVVPLHDGLPPVIKGE